jgi:hypothetical protein
MHANIIQCNNLAEINIDSDGGGGRNILLAGSSYIHLNINMVIQCMSVCHDLYHRK